MKQARDQGLTVGFVSVTERKKVVDWLEGKGGVDDSRIQGEPRFKQNTEAYAQCL